MSEIKKEVCGANYAAATVGYLSEFVGKAFLKDVLSLTAMEVSVGTLSPGEAAPFFHSHKQNEELYVVLSGSGDFQVDDDLFPIASGSVVRVSPAGVRNLRNTSDEVMRYLCVQAHAGSLQACTMGDGNVVEHTAKW